MAKYKKLGEELAYRGGIIEVYRDRLLLPDGKKVVYDLIRHSGGAAVLPITEDGRLVVVRQYRNSVDKEVYEIPAGLLEPTDKSGETCARRELQEETGYIAGSMEFIAQVYGAIGVCDEKTDIYLAEKLTPCERHPDPEEFIDVCYLKLEDAVRMIKNREIIDAKTVIAIQYYQLKSGDNTNKL